MPAKKYVKHRHLPAFILLTLAEGSAHGGAIYASLMKWIPNFKSDTGAIYRTLQQLEADDAVISAWDTTNSGPARKIYSITDVGWMQLDYWRQDIEERTAALKYFLDTYSALKR